MTTKSNILLFFIAMILLTSCNGQNLEQKVKVNHNLEGDTTTVLDSSIMVIYQDKKNTYWFGSWETGVYKYDGKKLINFTTKHGLPNNRIDEIKEDKSGIMYFTSYYPKTAITKFDGSTFTTLSPNPSNDWQLNSTDMWFRHSYENENKVYRYDGISLHELHLAKPPNLSNPFGIYSIYKDKKGNIWFGTNPVGVCRYDGKSFDWMKNNKFYTRHKSIGGLDGKLDSDLDEYLSALKDDNNDLWFVTYRDGVWKYDGKKITQYVAQNNSKDITTFCIYKDNNGDLWLGTEKNGAYKFNGKSFEKFKLDEY